MSSLFEGPDVTNAQTRAALRDLEKTQKKIRQTLQPLGISAGGLTSVFTPGSKRGAPSLSITATPERQGLVKSIADRFLEQAGLTSDLRAKVAPGMSELRSSRLQQIEDARRGAVSNLRDNLARRRVLGSSFAEDALSRAEIEFAREKERVAAESFLMELDLTNQLINQEFELSRSAFATQLGELNVQADLAARLSAQATETLSASAQLQAQMAVQRASINSQLGIAQAELDARAQEGAGSLIGKIAGTLLGPAGEALGGKIAAAVT